MNYASINKVDVANGDGIRVSVFVSGCKHCCKGCFNEEAWDFNYGQKFTEDTINEIINAMNHGYISGLTILGGEPFDPDNIKNVTDLCRLVKSIYPEKSIWAYTGFVYEEICNNEVMKYIDVLVDGPFIYEERDLTLKFKGSKNQRVIDVPKTRTLGHITLYIE